MAHKFRQVPGQGIVRAKALGPLPHQSGIRTPGISHGAWGGRVYEDSQWLRKMDEGWIEAYDRIQSQTKDHETLKRKLRELLICQKGETVWNDTGEDAAKNGGGEGDNVLQRKSE